jgi:hypothetical protein
MYVEVGKVHEQMVDIRITVSHSENGPYVVYYGYLDLEAGDFTPLSGDRYPSYEEFWINPERVNKPARCRTILPCPQFNVSKPGTAVLTSRIETP